MTIYIELKNGGKRRWRRWRTLATVGMGTRIGVDPGDEEEDEEEEMSEREGIMLGVKGHHPPGKGRAPCRKGQVELGGIS